MPVAVPLPDASNDSTTFHTIDALGQWPFDDVLSDPYPELQQSAWQAQPDFGFSLESLDQYENVWIPQTDDYFESPEQIQQMLGFCRSCELVKKAYC